MTIDPPTTKILRECFAEGRAAAYDQAKTARDNPYTPGDVYSLAWTRGWCWVRGGYAGPADNHVADLVEA